MWQKFLTKLKAVIQPKAVHRQGHMLYASCVDQARKPAFYLNHGVEDAIGARFELLTLHVTMIIHALKSVPKEDSRHEHAADLAQTLFDAFLEALDNTLREQGVGDLTVPKKMKKLAAVVYTRMTRWDALWQENSAVAQTEYLARTVYAGTAYESEDSDDATLIDGVVEQARWLCDYIARVRSNLDINTLLSARINWPETNATEAA